MTDNARHVPGSIRSCGPVLPRFATPARRFRTVPENPYKTRTKSDHFRICEFSIASASITYNFNALKCADFSALRPCFLPDELDSAAKPLDTRMLGTVECCSFSLGEKVRMRDRLLLRVSTSPVCQKLFNTCTKRDKTGRITIVTKANRVVPTTYDDTSLHRPILRSSPALCSTRTGKNRKFPEFRFPRIVKISIRRFCEHTFTDDAPL